MFTNLPAELATEIFKKYKVDNDICGRISAMCLALTARRFNTIYLLILITLMAENEGK